MNVQPSRVNRAAACGQPARRTSTVCCDSGMPRLIATESRTDCVVAAINHLLARDGATGISIRAIAQQAQISASSLLHHYGSREHLLRVAAVHTGRARVSEVDRNAWKHGPLAFLPLDFDDVLDARAWLAWLELWRSNDTLTTAIEDARLDERALLAELVDYRLDRDELDTVAALIDGLLTAICAPVRPMPLARAREILTARIGARDDPTSQPTAPSADDRALDEIRNRSRRWRDRGAS
jgi:TetR/AcrR family transcriptional regulator, transcriptional repressor of bet genes